MRKISVMFKSKRIRSIEESKASMLVVPSPLQLCPHWQHWVGVTGTVNAEQPMALISDWSPNSHQRP